MDPSELARKLHDRLAEAQSKTDDGKSKKFLKWDDLDHPGFKGRYDAYKKAFVETMEELATDHVSIPKVTKEDEEKFAALLLGARRCYCCSRQFVPKTTSQFACDRCVGEP